MCVCDRSTNRIFTDKFECTLWNKPLNTSSEATIHEFVPRSASHPPFPLRPASVVAPDQFCRISQQTFSFMKTEPHKHTLRSTPRESDESQDVGLKHTQIHARLKIETKSTPLNMAGWGEVYHGVHIKPKLPCSIKIHTYCGSIQTKADTYYSTKVTES